MYIPKQFLTTDQAEMYAFMQRYSFALIITAKNNMPIATHLPFVVIENKGKINLLSHFAKANPQWRDIESQKILVVFSEPHAYISPTHYDNPISVPTWNYIAVHAYGQAQIIQHEAETLDILTQTINNYEKNYLDQWKTLPDDYKKRMAKDIVAFKIEVTEWQGKQKLSQNKNINERQRIIDTLSQSNNTSENEIAAYMHKLDL